MQCTLNQLILYLNSVGIAKNIFNMLKDQGTDHNGRKVDSFEHKLTYRYISKGRDNSADLE